MEESKDKKPTGTKGAPAPGYSSGYGTEGTTQMNKDLKKNDKNKSKKKDAADEVPKAVFDVETSLSSLKQDFSRGF